MTRAEIRNRARKYFDDATDSVVTNTNIDSMINEGYMLLAEAYRLPDTETISVVSGTQEYDLPSDFLSVIQVERVATSTVAGAWLYDTNDKFSTDTGYYISATGKIGFTPSPTSAYTVTLTYAKRPADLATDGDSPLLPREYHEALAEYAAGRCQQIDQVYSSATFSMTQWEAMLNKAEIHGKTMGRSSVQTRVAYY